MVVLGNLLSPKSKKVLIVEADPGKLVPLLFGPGGAIVALLMFLGYLVRETSSAKKERDAYQKRYEDMREQRDEFRFLAGDAIRPAKRSSHTAMAISKHRIIQEQDS